MQAIITPVNVPDQWLAWIVLVVLLALFMLVGKKASADDVELRPDAGYRRPMFALEMNAGAADKMFVPWNDSTRGKLRAALHWDYLFIFIYPATIATACFIAGRFLDRAGIVSFKYSLLVMCLMLIAPLLDATENAALLRVLRGPIEAPWPQIARWCAISKFIVIVVGDAYAVIFGGGVWLILNVARLWSHLFHG
jgi:hypothetical protein